MALLLAVPLIRALHCRGDCCVASPERMEFEQAGFAPKENQALNGQRP
jgi:hypothetical protein